MKLQISRQIFEKYTSILMKMCEVGAEFFHAGGRTDGQIDRRTDVTNLIVAFRNISNSTKKGNT